MVVVWQRASAGRAAALTRRHLGPVKDGDVAHEARRQLRPAAVAAVHPTAAAEAAAAAAAPAAAVRAPRGRAAEAAAAAAAEGLRLRRRRDLLEARLLLRRELLVLGVAEVVVVAAQVVAEADDRVHARLVARDARVDAALVDGAVVGGGGAPATHAAHPGAAAHAEAGGERRRARRRDQLVLQLLLLRELLVLGLAEVVVVALEVPPVADDRVHAGLVARDAGVAAARHRRVDVGGDGRREVELGVRHQVAQRLGQLWAGGGGGGMSEMEMRGEG